jgi:glucokinase
VAWTFDAEGLRSGFGWPRLLLINNLEAMALGIPLLSGEG